MQILGVLLDSLHETASTARMSARHSLKINRGTKAMRVYVAIV